MSGDFDEKNLSSFAEFAPWRHAGYKSACADATARDVSQERRSTTDEGSSTDAGDDITPCFVDLDNYDSYSEASYDGTTASLPSPRSPVAATPATCIYSVMLLLRLRNAVCDEDEPEVRYGSCAISDLPAQAAAKPKTSPKARTSSSEELSWRQPVEALPSASAESWVTAQKKRDPVDDEMVTRAFRSILNKLTVEKFESLFEQLTTCGITEPHHVSILMREIFEKATTQHHFIPMYAELCVKLEKDPRIVSVVEEADQAHNFRRLLLNECQSVFEQVLESRSGEADADENAAFGRKQRALGNMKLIGHLLVHGMLSSDLFTACCEELLQKHAQCPEALEALVALMMVAGPKFDSNTWQYYKSLQHILTDMGLLTKNKSVAPRLRFLIRDVLDAREAGWPSSPGRGKVAAPSKLEEVAAAQIKEAAQAQQKPAAEKTMQAKLTQSAPWKTKKSADQSANAVKAPAKKAFEVVEFRRALATIFSDLASDKNIPAAVQRVREQKVPAEFQADQYVDILTRIVEERRGAVRRCELAFIAGLSAAESSAFERKECLAGVQLFFKDVYGELCNEVHRLPAIMKSEFMPTMLTVFPAAEINTVMPAGMRK